MTQKSGWKELFRRGDHIRLALELRQNAGSATPKSVRALADDRVLLLGGAGRAARQGKRAKSDRSIDAVVLTPEPDQSETSFEQTLADVREEYPEIELSGYSPNNKARCTNLFDRVVVQMGEAGLQFSPTPDWRDRLPEQSHCDVSLVLVYTPEVSPEALEQAARQASQVENLVSMVALPAGAGDRIPLPGLTTAGSTDVMVVSVLRHLLPSPVRVRASWAALGWKVAQMALLYGADELAGWTGAETLVYSGRVRAAARVEEDEVGCGLSEAGCQQAPWSTVKGLR